ncbi:MAG TPA: hypothetical protein VEK78_01065 [Gemmatimonadales bacterium]|nr:hypothetical protein [Gemmatimonadales bacterium]
MERLSFPAFRAAVLTEFPQLSDDFEGDDDLPYVQLGAFAKFTQAAKGRADWNTYERCVRITDRLFARASGDLENAFYVAYLEHLDFDGPRGPKAWSLLTPELQSAWRRITTSSEKRAALPRKKKGRS